MVQAKMLVMAKSGMTSVVLKEVETWPEVVDITLVSGTPWEIVLTVEGASIPMIKTWANLKCSKTLYMMDAQVWPIVSTKILKAS